jgi:putative hydrolase of the HAD superfamily
MIRAVVFDFYGTLVYAPDGAGTLTVVLEEHGYSLAPDLEYRWWNDIDGSEHREHSASREHYTAWQDGRLRATLEACEIDNAHVTPIITRVNERLGAQTMHAYEEAADVMASLRERGIVVAICSNWSWELEEALARAGLAGCADITLSSAWIGARKPHPYVYEHTIEVLGHDPNDVLFIGDTWNCDVVGPRAAGMHAMYLRRPDAPADPSAPDTLDAPIASDLTAVLQ